jgi:hypothetical protein
MKIFGSRPNPNMSNGKGGWSTLKTKGRVGIAATVSILGYRITNTGGGGGGRRLLGQGGQECGSRGCH